MREVTFLTTSSRREERMEWEGSAVPREPVARHNAKNEGAVVRGMGQCGESRERLAVQRSRVTLPSVSSREVTNRLRAEAVTPEKRATRVLSTPSLAASPHYTIVSA